MKRIFALLIISIICVTSALAQSILGTWSFTMNEGTGTATAYWTFEEGGKSNVYMKTVSTERAGKFTLKIIEEEWTYSTWTQDGKKITNTPQPRKTVIKVSSKVTGGTAAERAEAQEEADYYAQEYEAAEYESINYDVQPETLTIISATPNALKLKGADGRILNLKKATLPK